MPTIRLRTCLALLLAIGYALLAWRGHADLSRGEPFQKRTEEPALSRLGEEEEPETLKAARDDHFFWLLRDPATNALPTNIRRRELAYARTLPRALNGFGNKAGAVDPFDWQEAGPFDVGGRTRALAVDVANSNVVLAGAASGGIWKSTDAGLTWHPQSTLDQNLSVTSLAQDTRPGQTHVWYYTSGEFRGQSAADRGRRAPFFGTGIFKSVDNGETWAALPATRGGNATATDNPFDYGARVKVSPTTGTVLVATNLFGIHRSGDGGLSFEPVLGAQPFAHQYSEVEVTRDGTFIATLSSDLSAAQGQPNVRGGVFVSRDDGRTWVDQTPQDFPIGHARSVLAAAPSNPDAVYLFSNARETALFDGRRVLVEVPKLYKLSLARRASENLSSNLPALDDRFGRISTQGSYNMVLAVKPDDEDFVLIGGTTLFRSREGFRTASFDKEEAWVGGYTPDARTLFASFDQLLYEGHHPDQHVLAFDPSDPNKVWSGHDGGLSVSFDVTEAPVAWERRNRGYNVTQFYTVALAPGAGDDRLMGGTQDNGVPYVRWQQAATTPTQNLVVGDGAYVYFGRQHAYSSSQVGNVWRLDYDGSGNPFLDPFQTSFRVVPPSRQGQFRLFIHPFAVDPVDEDVMYYPQGTALWRHESLGQVNASSDTTRWTQVTQLIDDDQGFPIITTLTVTQSPAHMLYIGVTSFSNGAPRIFRLENAHVTARNAREISIPGAPDGAYVHSIAVNPHNGFEILVLFSNYNVTGLYHSLDGGATYTAVEGNLTGNAVAPGPSLRSAAILPTATGTQYVLGTSTGVYVTRDLQGDQTAWTQASVATIGNTVVEYVDARASDARVAIATHGRGLFVGTFQGDPVPQPSSAALAQNFPNPFTDRTLIPFFLTEASTVSITVHDVLGREVARLLTNTTYPAGQHAISYTPEGLASGTYYYRLEATATGGARGKILDTKTMVQVR